MLLLMMSPSPRSAPRWGQRASRAWGVPVAVSPEDDLAVEEREGFGFSAERARGGRRRTRIGRGRRSWRSDWTLIGLAGGGMIRWRKFVVISLCV